MMTAQYVLKLFALAAYVLLPCSARAYNANDTIQVQVSGQIIASTCEVQVNDTVNLGEVARRDISVAGANSGTVLVTFSLSQCSPQLTQATAAFSGTPYSADPAYANAIYANDIATGTTDVGLQLFNLDGKTQVNLANGVRYSIPVNSQTATASLPIGARMYTPHGTPTAGDFKSSVTVSFIYQ